MANVYDDLINGTFANPAMQTTGWLTPAAQPGMMGRTPPQGYSTQAATLDQINRDLAAAPAERWAVDANGRRIDPFKLGAASPSLPAPTYAYAPTGPSTPAVDATAQVANPAVNHVSGRMTPGQPRGDLLSLLMGPSKNGQTGLLGLLGGPQQGGLLGMLMGGQRPTSASRYTPEQLANRTAQGKAIGEANRNNPNPTYNISGENNAFMPQSVQNSVRWQTGY